MTRPLVVKITAGAEAPERANQGLTVASLAVAAGSDVTVWLTGEAVFFAVAGAQPDLALPYATAAEELVAAITAGAMIKVCSQCAARRDLTDDLLVPGASIAGAITFVEAVLQPDVQALVY